MLSIQSPFAQVAQKCSTGFKLVHPIARKQCGAPQYNASATVPNTEKKGSQRDLKNTGDRERGVSWLNNPPTVHNKAHPTLPFQPTCYRHNLFADGQIDRHFVSPTDGYHSLSQLLTEILKLHVEIYLPDASSLNVTTYTTQVVNILLRR